MEITTEQVKELRGNTGVSIMQCKKALEEAGGDMEKARVLLHKQAGRAAEKKSDRELGSGVIACYTHNSTIGAMVALASETDFVAKNEAFAALAREVAMQVAATNPQFKSREELPESEKQTLHEVFEKEAGDLLAQRDSAQASKPAEVKEKIIAGKFDAYFKERALLEQPYIKDDSKTIQQLLDEATQKFGERVALSFFTRHSI